VYQRYSSKSFLFVTWSTDELNSDFGPLPYSLIEDELLVLSVPHIGLIDTDQTFSCCALVQTI
jgi:hypothetical protein